MNRFEAWTITVGLFLLILLLPRRVFGGLLWLAVSCDSDQRVVNRSGLMVRCTAYGAITAARTDLPRW